MQSYEIISDISYNSTPLRERLPWPCLGHSHVHGRRELLHALAGALGRTKAVILLWDFADPSLDVSATIAKAVGLPYFNISKDPSAPFNLPRGAVPFVGAGASVYGYFLESGRQSIIVLSSLTGAAEFAAGAFVIPYLTARYGGSRSLPVKSAANTSEIQPVAKAEPVAADIPNAEIIQETPSPQASDIQEPSPVPEYTAVEPTPSDNSEPAAESSPWEFDYTALENSQPDEPADEQIKRKKAPLILKIATAVISLLIILIAGFAVYDFFLSGNVSDSIYEKIQSQSSDFTALSKINPDFAGWIKIDNTSIDFPVVIPKNKSAGHYKNHTFSGLYNKYGTPRLPEGFSAVDYCRNTVISAENRGDGRMFSDLEKYLDADYLAKNPIISYQSQYYTTSWRIIGVTIAENKPSKDEFNPELSKFADDTSFSEYLSNLVSYSLITTDAKLDSNDVLLTLITDYSGASGHKIALLARKLRYNETTEDTITAAVNGAVALPDSGGGVSVFDALPKKLREKITATRGTVPAFATGGAEESEVSSEAAPESTDETRENESYSSAPVSGGTSSSVSSQKSSSTVSASSTTKSSSAVSSKAAASSSSSTAAVAPADTQTAGDIINTSALKLTVTNQSTKAVVTGPAADIIAQVVEAEMSSSFHIEALKAQAITAYTWILNQGIAPLVPMKPAGANAIKATNEVLGKKVYYGGKPALVYYFAMSAGSTAPNTDTWTKGASYPYLISVDSSAEKGLAKFQTVNTYSATDAAKWIKAVCGVDLTDIDKNKWFTLTPGQNRLYIKNVNLGGLKDISGNELRLNVFNAANAGSSNALRSHAFEVGYNASNDSFTFVVKGYGHGVGMSQEGANLLAKSGKNYNEIIKHYFPGVTIS